MLVFASKPEEEALPTANINGLNIAYTDQGSGTPIVFIHGYPLSKAMWEPQAKGLASTFSRRRDRPARAR